MVGSHDYKHDRPTDSVTTVWPYETHHTKNSLMVSAETDACQENQGVAETDQ
jgi:hypothetical protein